MNCRTEVQIKSDKAREKELVQMDNGVSSLGLDQVIAALVDLGSPIWPMRNLDFLDSPVYNGADQGGSEDALIIEAGSRASRV